MNSEKSIPESPKEATNMKKKYYTSTYVSVAAILLSCLGAISVGFATWVISQGDSTSANGTINADTIDTNIKGVSIVGEPLAIGHYHFDNGNGNYSTTANLTYKISYDVSEIILSNTTTMTLRGSLSFGEGLEIFNNTYFTGVTYDATPATFNYHESNTAIEFTITQSIPNNVDDINNKELKFTINNKLVAKYGSQMDGGSFYLRLEVD